MTKTLQIKKDAALSAIREVHTDTSGPADDNLEALQELRDAAAELCAILEEEHENRN